MKKYTGKSNMKDKTLENTKAAFIGEAKAHFRLRAYAEKAEEEEAPQIASLFRAVSEAERVHATRHLNLMKDIVVKDTDTNLKESFNREKTVSENAYPDFIKNAEAEGEKAASITFNHARDAEEVHMKLYERALYNLMKNESPEYHVCQVCGYIAENEAPEKCPVCGVSKEKFIKIL
ncbi:rubrerythrin family protein [Spirochaetota bacterium]